MKVRTMAAAAALAVAAGGGAVAAATAANAQAGPLQVALYANGDSTAIWDTAGNPVLTPGSESGTSAQVDLASSYAGQQAPTEAPSFVATNYSAGDPRWVIEFHNGCYLFGSPVASGSSTFTWAENPGGNQSTDYTSARTWATQSCGTDNWVTSAFIVDDAGNHGVSSTLTGVQYDGQTINVLSGAAIGYAGRALDDYRSGTTNGTKVDLYAPNGSNAQHWTLEPDGTVKNFAAGSVQCLDDTAFGGQGSKVEMYQCNGGANQEWAYTNGHFVNQYNGLCINDPGYNTTNGTQQILWACGNYANENFMFPAAG